MPRAGPRRIYKYTRDFKLAAVRLSHQADLQVQAVAAALDIHPFMLSKWRKDVRDGTLRGRLPKAAPAGPAREIVQLQVLERKYALLQEEHDLLKKALRGIVWVNLRGTTEVKQSLSEGNGGLRGG